MNFIIGVLGMIGLPIVAGKFIDGQWNRNKILRKNRRDIKMRLFMYWMLGMIPAMGIVFIFILFSALGKGLVWLF